MNLVSLIARELRERPAAVAASVLAVALGVTAFVAIRNITVFSEQAVASQLENLGANVLVLPKDVSLQDYYSADLHGKHLPEEHVGRLALTNLVGMEKLSPKLCVPAEIQGRSVTVTGILPQSEFQAKAAWQAGRMFRKHEGCKGRCHVAPEGDADDPTSLARTRVIQDLGEDEALVGAEVAEALAVKPGDTLEMLGSEFSVLAVLPATGTVDDSRVFAHLHTVQDLSGAGPVVNVIEIMGCCEDVANGMPDQLRDVLPDVKVVTISQVVSTQADVNRLMGRLSWLFLGILALVGGASMANSMYSNVRERRREIGTLMALGATPRLVTRLFLWKAAALGLVGGVAGYVVGTILAVAVGGRFAGIAVYPLPILAVWALAAAMGVTLAASILPARWAAALDPCVCVKEI